MRLFTGLDLPADVLGNLERLLRRLKPAARIQWSPVENLHVTTKFIGHWPDERLGELKDALAAIGSRTAIPVSVRRVGFYPNPHSPRVFWTGIEAPGLEQLAKDTDDATAALGVEREDRAYSPHLTLARIKERIDMQPLREVIAGLDSLDFGRFTADRFFLYQSTLKPSGSVYTKLAEFPLTKS
jgi:RNA 2',3'-cyclic 3'-phosphodiesterase